MDIHKLKECVRDNVGDLTFAESFALTGRVLNIAVASANQAEPHRLLNYLTSPDVLVWSAAVCIIFFHSIYIYIDFEYLFASIECSCIDFEYFFKKSVRRVLCLVCSSLSL